MTLSSMTGFSRTNGQDDAASWVWELRSVNAKGLDLRLRLPPRADQIEAEARRMLGAVIIRGTIHASLDLTLHGASADVRINEPLARRLLAQAGALARAEGLPAPGVEAVLAVRGVIEAPDEAELLTEDIAKAVNASLEDAIVALVSARRAEGDAVKRILSAKVKDMAAKVAAADALPSRGVDAVRERLRRQVDELLGAAGGGLDPQRLHQEAVLIAVKADIREELDRLKAHVQQARELLARGGAVGRRLDFLAQELSREVNTLCAKSNDVALTELGLDLKGLVEQFREQVQNVE
jgi:uncharacterized protein (TIGR00255 family)